MILVVVKFLVYELQRQLNSKTFMDVNTNMQQKIVKRITQQIIFQDLKKLTKGHKEFDLVTCINVSHNLKINQISESLKEIERVSKHKFVCVESMKMKNNNSIFNVGPLRKRL